MEHRESVHIVPGADTAVLLIHGIVGTPDHFRHLAPLEPLIPQEWSVHNLLLAGHGGEVENFSAASMDNWKQQARAAFEALSKTHRHVFLVGHSMGTLLALMLAQEYSRSVCGLYLLACPLYVGLRPKGLFNCVKVAFGTIDRKNPREAATLTACGVNADGKLWKYIGWLPRIAELYALMVQTRRQFPKIVAPTLAVQSQRDELVSNRSAEKLKRQPGLQVEILKDSSHFYYTDADRENLCRLFVNMCEEIKKQD